MKINKFLSLFAIAVVCFPMTACNSKNENGNENNSNASVVLNVYNSAEYICETDIETDTVGTIDLFEQYCKEEFNTDVHVNYSTFETNEDMYNQLKAGGVRYDLVCPSDYMIEKMIMSDMIEPLSAPVENYETYGSNYIKDTFNNIKTHTGDGTVVKFGAYAVPYMWGTLGFMYDPNPQGIAEDLDIEKAVSSWDVIWDVNYKNKTSLKDSIRDTYAVGALHVYKEELRFAKELLEAGKITIAEYNNKVGEIMNRCDDDTLTLVESSLKKAKENVYEFEVDTGKEHIVKGDYWINFCWSGDAVYALDLADEENFTLNYKVPEEGSNVWFDGWVMPKGANKVWAERLMNFLCDPEIAALNMDAVGYTSAIAGQEMWDLVVDWYDEEESEDTVAYDLTYFFENTGIVDDDDNEMTSFIIHTSEINRQLYAQYPDKETIARCAVMKDFGAQNDKVSELWIRVKGNTTSWYLYVILGVVVVVIIFAEVKSILNRKTRKNRNKAKNKA